MDRLRRISATAPALLVCPCSVKQATAYVREHHRHLPRIQGGMWAVKVQYRDIGDSGILGVAIVGWPARLLMAQNVLCVLRVATNGAPNACSALYGATARAARGMGASGLVTYTLADEPGTSLRAAGWIAAGQTEGGSWSRPSRERSAPVEGGAKTRWWAPWSAAVKGVVRAMNEKKEATDGE